MTKLIQSKTRKYLSNRRKFLSERFTIKVKFRFVKATITTITTYTVKIYFSKDTEKTFKHRVQQMIAVLPDVIKISRLTADWKNLYALSERELRNESRQYNRQQSKATRRKEETTGRL